MSNSHSSDIECGPAFSSSISSRANDSPRMSKRQNANSGSNNQGFEFIEREIGMCRPVCSPNSLFGNEKTLLLLFFSL